MTVMVGDDVSAPGDEIGGNELGEVGRLITVSDVRRSSTSSLSARSRRMVVGRKDVSPEAATFIFLGVLPRPAFQISREQMGCWDDPDMNLVRNL